MVISIGLVKVVTRGHIIHVMVEGITLKVLSWTGGIIMWCGGSRVRISLLLMGHSELVIPRSMNLVTVGTIF